MESHDTTIVGAGISGLTSAIALGRCGIDVVVHERAPQFTTVGAGIQLAPNATAMLGRLGLEPKLLERAVAPDSVDLLRWSDGEVIARTELGTRCRDRYGSPYLTMHRADLLDVLLDGLGRGRVVTGAELTSVHDNGHRVDLQWRGRPSTSTGLLIGADGIRSTVRELLADDRPVFSGQSIYRAVVDAEHVPRAFVADPRVRVWLGPERHAVCYPISGAEQFSVGATVAAENWFEESWTTPGDHDALLAAYAGWDPNLAKVLRAADKPGCWALHDREPIDRWAKGRVVVIGDAAHPMLPFMAQGANQAIEDAVALARFLGDNGPADPAKALRRFEQARMARTVRVQAGSRANKERLHLDDGDQQEERDAELLADHALAEQDWLFGYDAEYPKDADVISSVAS